MKRVFVFLIISTLAACANQPTQPSSEIIERSIGTDRGIIDKKGNAIHSTGSTFHPLQDPDSTLAKRSIYYDFNSYAVTNEYRGLVLAHARYLKENTNTKILLQGNTDARGSREYNLALGQRRADNVKNMMLLSGVHESQIESVSLGEEKPRATGQGEAVWIKNRRVDIIYQGE